jgi:tRNA-2-methylthio-N6-dimethylallyladenosine synthase
MLERLSYNALSFMTQREIPLSNQASEIGAGPLPFSSEAPIQIQAARGVYISTYGCQMNANDSERMYSLMEMANFTPVEKPEDASIIIINACSVREKPVQKVYSEVGRYRKLKDRNPDLRIGVAGCVGQQEKENLIKNQPLIDFVFGTDNIDELPTLVRKLYEDDGHGKIVQARFQHREPYHIETMVRNPGVSTFVNIMKGCDNFCSFCIVPFTRGREKSRPVQHILTDIQHLVKRGVKEVTLLGQNVNSFKNEDGIDFTDLLVKVLKETGIERLRYTTSHPKDFNQKLIDAHAVHSDRLCEFIHLPVQSGSTKILASMNRGYSREDYFEKLAMIKRTLPKVNLSTDIIIGFPGETEEDFQDTLSLIETVAFDSLYAYKYSPRPFTKAARFEDQVPEDVKSERLERLFQAHENQAFEQVKKYDNQVLQVLVEKEEGVADGDLLKMSGRDSGNKLIHFLGLKADIGQTIPVRVTRAFPNVLRGEKVIHS